MELPVYYFNLAYILYYYDEWSLSLSNISLGVYLCSTPNLYAYLSNSLIWAIDLVSL